MTHERIERRSCPRHTTAILAIILISYFMILLDNSIIFTALPTIHTATHYSTTGLALYGATAGIGASLGLVIGGALADWATGCTCGR